MDAKLVVVRGKTNKREVPLRLPTVVGRSKEAGLTIPHSLVSRRHCTISEQEGGLFVEDHGSTNGTLVGGKRVTRQLLRPGDLLSIGPLTFQVVYQSIEPTLDDGLPPMFEEQRPAEASEPSFPPCDFDNFASTEAPEIPAAESGAGDLPEFAPSGASDGPRADFFSAPTEEARAPEAEPIAEAPPLGEFFEDPSEAALNAIAEAQPVEAQPVEAQPVEAQPVEAQPVEALPAEAIPLDALPAESLPAQAIPIEAPASAAQPWPDMPAAGDRTQAGFPVALTGTMNAPARSKQAPGAMTVVEDFVALEMPEVPSLAQEPPVAPGVSAEGETTAPDLSTGPSEAPSRPASSRAAKAAEKKGGWWPFGKKKPAAPSKPAAQRGPTKGSQPPGGAAPLEFTAITEPTPAPEAAAWPEVEEQPFPSSEPAQPSGPEQHAAPEHPEVAGDATIVPAPRETLVTSPSTGPAAAGNPSKKPEQSAGTKPRTAASNAPVEQKFNWLSEAEAEDTAGSSNTQPPDDDALNDFFKKLS